MPDIQNNLSTALLHHQNNDLNTAKKLYTEILNKEPNNTQALHFYGLLLLQQNDIKKACESFERAIQHNPPEELLKDSLSVLAEIYLSQNLTEKAKSYFENLINIDSSNFAGCYHLADIYLQENNIDKAIPFYHKALRHEVNQIEIYTKLIEAYKQKNNIDKIIYCYFELIKLEPKNPYHYFNIGLYYTKNNDAENTYKSYLNAITLKPDFAEAHINLANIYLMMFNLQDAEKHFLQALESNDNFLEIYVNLGNLYIDTAQVDKVIKISEQGLKKFPDNQGLLFNISRAEFLKGNLDKGWEYFKLRRIINEKKGLKTYLLDNKQPLTDKKVLVYNDSGFGDSIQFLRYVPLLKEQGAKVLLKIQPALVELIKHSNIDAEIIPDNQTLQETEHDFQVNITSLTYLFKTTMDSFPLKDKYLFAPTAKTKEFKQKYFNNNKFKIGIAWYSHVNLFRKNIENIKTFYPIAQIPNIEIYSLQQTKGKPLLDNLPDDFNLINLEEELKTFSDTAAIIENLDLVLAIDTAIVHLAGAMGKPTWCMLPSVPNWRWFLEGEKTPWYESMKLFRQKEEGNWDTVIQEVTQELKKII